jgi:hypothetical protein
MNLCCECNEDFGSVQAFDKHRVGKHAYSFAEGLEKDLEDGRRCLGLDEFAEAGLVKNQRGAWSLASSLERARELNQKD